MPKRDAVFAAIADPTRRGILERLRARGVLAAGEIAASVPSISRPAVSRHLRVLRAAGLVHAVEVGREWHYRLDPDPLRSLHDEWFAPFAPLWQPSLVRLKRRAESEKHERRRGSKRETPAAKRPVRAH